LQSEKLTDEERQNILQSLERRERDFTRLQRQRLSATDFELLTIIGRGAFGEVYCLAGHDLTNNVHVIYRASSRLYLHPRTKLCYSCRSDCAGRKPMARCLP